MDSRYANENGASADFGQRQRLSSGMVARRGVDRVFFGSRQFASYAKGRWEHLHLLDIYLIRPDGSGLKRVSKHGDFCGSPRWSQDGKSLIAYCLAAQDTWTFRTYPEDGETTLMKIDVATSTATPMNAGPSVKLFASILPSGELGFVRRDKKAIGIFYSNGKKGPAAGGAISNRLLASLGRHQI